MIETHTVKDAARGRWGEILLALSAQQLKPEQLGTKHGPCPVCDGKDRFRAMNDFAETGALFCSQCFNKKNGDGLAALMWLNGWTFPQTMAAVADYLGVIDANSSSHDIGSRDPLADLAMLKRVSADSLRAYGADPNCEAVVFPVFDPVGQQCSTFSIWPRGSNKQRKGMFAKGKPAGLFFPVIDGNPRLPARGETWLLTEGVKDASSLHSLDYLACGLNTKLLAAKFAPMFAGVFVVIVPDRDTAGDEGVIESATLLADSAMVSVVTLPIEWRETGGADVRDVLASSTGHKDVANAIANAIPVDGPVTNGRVVEVGKKSRVDGRRPIQLSLDWQ